MFVQKLSLLNLISIFAAFISVTLFVCVFVDLTS